MINLFSSYYLCGDAARQSEMDFCLEQNIQNDEISKIFLFIDDGSDPKQHSDKLKIIHLDRRPTYQNWVQYTQMYMDSGISVLANSDIYFDGSITKIRKVLAKQNSFVALSRWEDLKSGIVLHPNPHWSQDVWAIRADQAVDESITARLKFSMGTPRCDNKVAYVFGIYGWDVYNPCKDIKTYHLHETELRTYNKRHDDAIIGGVAYVHPGKHLTDPALLDLDVWVKKAISIKKVALNNSLERWLKEDSEPQTKQNDAVISSQELPCEFAPVPVTNKELIEALRGGKRLYSASLGYDIWYHNNRFIVVRGFGSDKSVAVSAMLNEWLKLKDQLIAILIPPVIMGHTRIVSDRQKSADDAHFWQYPCATEKQAYLNHLRLDHIENVDFQNKTLNVYLPLPWATYIDKRSFSPDLFKRISAHTHLYRTIAQSIGYDLRIHTVCQHIRWKNILPYAESIGITDLHLSHNDTDAKQLLKSEGYDFTISSWPLIAPNIEISERRQGIQIGKPIEDKSYLASFVGAHMPHYRSEVRLELARIAALNPAPDILIRVNDEWHFNKIVYEEQVANRALQAQDVAQNIDDTRQYNEILSDSIFSICPEGAGPNTLRFWESLAIGAIPVVIAKGWIPHKIDQHFNLSDFAVFVSTDDLPDLFEYLRAIPREKIERMQLACIKAYETYKGVLTFQH